MAPRRWRAAPALAAASLALLGGPGALAQSGPVPTVSRPVVQPLPSRDALRLNAALARLGRNPRDVDALIDAGDAALAMGDTDAAAGFFRRADQVSPNNARVLAGLAGATVRGNHPVDAIPLFARAEQAGASGAAFAGDRGLAYDLVGDNARAQEYYRQALAAGEDPEIRRRLALSEAIAGDGHAAEATLLPLLQVQDKAAWRTRAFVFAILGQAEAAVTVAKTLLPGDLAGSVTPYLRYMPRLTRAQQAAAANFGVFPRAAEVGIDDPRIAQFTAATGLAPRQPAAGRQLVAKGEPLGEPARSRGERGSGPHGSHRQTRAERAAALAARTAPPEPLPVRTADGEPEPPVRPPSTPPPRPAAASGTVATSQARPDQPRPAPVPSPRTGAAPPAAAAASVPQLAAIAEGTGRPAPARAMPAPAPEPSLAAAFADLGAPAADAVPRAGAIDVSRLAPARPQAARTRLAIKPREAEKPPPPSHPSRIWVQLGVGRDKGALAFDWRKLAREGGDLFKGKQPFVSEWGQTNRMLTGPFESEAAAARFVTALDKAGVGGPFIWVSPAGQVVDSLPLR